MNEEIMLVVGLGLFAIGFGLKHYQKLRTKIEEALEDGELTLDEALDITKSIESTIEEVRTLPSPSALKRMRKDEIAKLCVEYGIDAEGTKAILIEKLQEVK